MNCMGKVGGIVDGLVVNFDDDISGAESGFFPATAFFHRAHQHALAIFDAKEVSQLGSDVLHHQAAARQLVNDDDGDGKIEVRHRGHLGHFWHGRHIRLPCHRLVPVGQLHFDRHGLTVATDPQANDAARRSFLDHAAQLSSAFDGRAVEAQYDVVFVQAGFTSGSVLVNGGDLDSVFLIQFEGSEAIRGNVLDVDTEVGGSGGALL